MPAHSTKLMWVKICGMTTADAVAASLEARVDAIGFVFAESVRRVSAQEAVTLAAPARGRTRLVAVMRHPSQQALEEILQVFQPDILQTDSTDLSRLRLPQQLELLPVLRSSPGDDGNLPARILFEGIASGTGKLSDWAAADQLARRTQLVLAGGLDATNVAAAIAAVKPFGVDVSSGVEARRGIKCPMAIVNFVTAARQTSAVCEDLV